MTLDQIIHALQVLRVTSGLNGASYSNGTFATYQPAKVSA
jgi:hypothetical protein